MLVIDTSTEKGFVALSETQVIFLSPEKKESIHLVATIKKLLNGKKPSCIAIGLGPGSFIGTRVGVLVGKMLAYAWDIPLKTFPSPAAFGDRVAIDAKSRGIYLYENGTTILTKEPQINPLTSPHPHSLRVPCADVRETSPDLKKLFTSLAETSP
ncbi:MAG: hypothetical protein P0S94_00045, partial [Simkaniaceae bacterium]|nr:hypothetical protein [Simkaniaceae bacterium]